MVATKPPTLLAEWRPKAASKAYPAAVARAVRENFGLQGVPVRVLPLSKERRSQPQRAPKNMQWRARGQVRPAPRATALAGRCAANHMSPGSRGGSKSNYAVPPSEPKHAKAKLTDELSTLKWTRRQRSPARSQDRTSAAPKSNVRKKGKPGKSPSSRLRRWLPPPLAR
jgi:hypothetical protein